MTLTVNLSSTQFIRLRVRRWGIALLLGDDYNKYSGRFLWLDDDYGWCQQVIG